MTAAIVVERLSKRYRVGLTGGASSVRDELVRLTRRALGGAAVEPSPDEAFWALRDVSFSVDRGEIVGILGRNGAGKSTLLKILSRITRPTEGRVRLRGRVGSLLEVGTGFNQELTGRENVYLSGAILGMSRREIKARFDAIAAFAEIEGFLDTPVKRYSSGMYMRLAFAVAAHLEPEILIVDEVLGVGDATFQKKCNDKIQTLVKAEGRTILLVSHNVEAIRVLCRRALVLHQGRLLHDGDLEPALRLYTHCEELAFDDQGRIVLTDLNWIGGGLTAPERADTRTPFTVERTYAVTATPVRVPFAISYFACVENRYGAPSDLLIGREVVTAAEARQVGLHRGTSPPLHVGRPGRQYLVAVLDAERQVAEADATNNVAIAAEPIPVEGTTDLVLGPGATGYWEVGEWNTSDYLAGYTGAVRYCAAGAGAAVVHWQFGGLTPGEYVVQASWTAHANRASNAPYRLYDGDTLLQTVRVDQQRWPVGPTVRSSVFQELARVRLSSGTLTVSLANDANQFVIADAVRVVGAGKDEGGP